MSATVSGPRPVTQYHEGKSNKVLAVTPIQAVMVRYTNSAGAESMALLYCFGKSTVDGGVGVYVVAGEKQLSETLSVPNAELTKQVREAMEVRGLIANGELVLGNAVAPVVEFSGENVFADVEESA